jgi:hypothetical protein
VNLIGPPPFPDKQKMDIIDWDDTGFYLIMILGFVEFVFFIVSTPKPSSVPPTTESLGGTGKGTAGEGPPLERENTHFTS